jgi:hypothetical protein
MSDSNEVDLVQLDKDAHARLTPEERSEYKHITALSELFQTVMATHVTTRAREEYYFAEHANVGPGWMMMRTGNPSLGIVSSFDLTDIEGYQERSSDPIVRSSAMNDVADKPGDITWHPVEEMREELRDGRNVLLKYDLGILSDYHERIIIGKWSKKLKVWVWQMRAVRAYSDIYQPTHYAEINLP